MLRFALLNTLYLILSTSSYSQKETNIWHFGYGAGVDFNSGTPVAVITSSISASEGGATICDAAGNLLFYTDGMKVFDKTHHTMPNGNINIGYIGLTSSASQSAVIIPKPGSSTIYYLFITSDTPGWDGLRYNEIDMTLNGGLGDVVTKQNLLYLSTTEKITAVNNTNGTDVWVITHKSDCDSFMVYSVTAAGINPSPVISKVGVKHLCQGTGSPTISGCQGEIKVSVDGTKLAATTFQQSQVELFDFNPTTGVVSNPLILASGTAGSVIYYGVEFSPDVSKLYVGNLVGAIYQYNLLAGSNAAIIASQFTVTNKSGSTLQLGPDCKIYIAKNSKKYLSAILAPNNLGAACTFKDTAVSLSIKQSGHGLPCFNQSYFQSLCTSVCNIVPNLSQTNVFCNGGSGGSASVNPSGGTSPYSYLWNNGKTTSSRSGLAAGTYTLTITDNAACSKMLSITITVPSVLTVSTSATAVSCSSTCDGILTAIVSGGTTAYSYSWSTGKTQLSQSGLCAGTYTLVVTDAGGCSSQNARTIAQPSVLSLAVTSVSVNCNGASTGSANANASGGSSPYNYTWSNGYSSNGSTSLSTGLSSQIYSVTVTDNAGCISSSSFLISQPSAITIATNVSNASCGQSNGTAMATAAGGTPGYVYHWSNGQTFSLISNLGSQIYSVTVTDTNGCDETTTATVNNAGGVVAQIISSASVTCFGTPTGSAIAGGTGGTAPYSYNWSNGATTSSIYNLTFNIYNFTVTDANGCSSVTSIFINEPAIFTVTILATNLTCNSGSNGSATAIVNGGTPSYNYIWNNGFTSNGSTSLSTGLSSQIYSVTVTDMAGCSTTISFLITEPAVLTMSISTSMNCSTGNSTANATGGTNPYSYSWNNGAIISQISNLSSQIYSCTVTDINNCLATATITVVIGATITAAVSSSVTITIGTSATLSAYASGLSPVNYNWFPSAGLNCTTCQYPVANPIQTTAYCVSVSTNNNCSDTACVIVTVDEKCEPFIPDAFSPNEDGINDSICVYGANCSQNMLFTIYSRWGQIVFQTRDPNKCWNGISIALSNQLDAMDMAVFVFHLQATLVTGDVIDRKGNFTLVR